MPPELGFQKNYHHHHHQQQHQAARSRSSLIIKQPKQQQLRDASPDDSSLIFTPESNLSLFSSASASADRCSFASDAAPDPDSISLVSAISLHLGEQDDDLQESSSGSDLDPNKPTVSSRLTRKAEQKAKEIKGSHGEIEDATVPTLDSARHSFSLALKECQERRSRSEALLKNQERRRPVSLDLNSVAIASSPRVVGGGGGGGGAMKKSSASSSTRRSGAAFPSPGTPSYRHGSVGVQKGWCSERVPAHAHAGRRNAATATALLPFNNNGRTLPSKWEDAERWIFSPVAGAEGGFRPAQPQPQRRPKSKSGPLGPPGVAYQSLYSPVVPMFDAGHGGNFMASSPFSAGVIAADSVAVPFVGRGCGGAFPVHTEPCMGRSASVHEIMGHSLSGSQDEAADNVKDAASCVSCTISRRDMATQMSPGSSTHSSPKRRLSFSLSDTSFLPIAESNHSRLEVRDVQIDERVTMTRWSKKHRGRISGKSSGNTSDRKKRAVNAQSSSWELSETGKSISRIKREEAKITAWENLQKAKAEAAIRKLEMNLEKKRSSSMDKILNKLRSAQQRAQEMRNSVSSNQAHQVARASRKAIIFRRTRHMGSLSGCFTCHAF